jgi:ketosteroid isomerase-like protein
MDQEAVMTAPVETVRRFYDALGRGDVSAVLALLDPQVEWTEAERFPYYDGTWHGPQAVLDNLLVPLSGDWHRFSAQAHEFIAEGDRVVSLGTYSGTFKRTGRSFSAAFVHVWTVRDDRLARFAMHTDTAKVLEAVNG